MSGKSRAEGRREFVRVGPEVSQRRSAGHVEEGDVSLPRRRRSGTHERGRRAVARCRISPGGRGGHRDEFVAIPVDIDRPGRPLFLIDLSGVSLFHESAGRRTDTSQVTDEIVTAVDVSPPRDKPDTTPTEPMPSDAEYAEIPTSFGSHLGASNASFDQTRNRPSDSIFFCLTVNEGECIQGHRIVVRWSINQWQARRWRSDGTPG